MNRGFIEIGRPRLAGEVYVVEGVNARGQRLRLVIDAYDGDLISRTRLDPPLLPPADVERERSARVGPFRGGPGPGFDDEFAPPSPGRDFGRERIERGDLPPLPAARRAERIEPPVTEPRRSEPAKPQRQTAKPAPSRQPAKASPAGPQTVPPAPTPPVEAAKPAPAEPPAATAAAPALPVNALQIQEPAPAASAPVKETPATEKPAEAPAQRTVRVIEGVTPAPGASAPSEASRPDDRKIEITPPAALE
jgi:hypothetical protein